MANRILSFFKTAKKKILPGIKWRDMIRGNAF